MITWEEVLSNRKRWIEELKNPESKQAVNTLFDAYYGSYCALGHGVKLTPSPRKTTQSGIEYYWNTGYYLKVYLGLKTTGSDFVASANDFEEKSLQEIAVILEEQMQNNKESFFFEKEEWEDYAKKNWKEEWSY